MTSREEIIIDDVDVSKCNYFNNTDKSYCEECCSEFGCAICNDRPNCYYKQLKRKEQENKKLKEDEKSLLNIIDNLQKEKNKWVEKYNDLGQDFDQLKQTLTEIKEIAKENIRIADLEGLNGVYRRGLATQILQKISEVEEQC